MAVDALCGSGMDLRVLELRFIQVAVLALRARIWYFIVLPQLHHTLVGVVADHAVQSDVLTLEELLVLFVMANETAAGVD